MKSCVSYFYVRVYRIYREFFCILLFGPTVVNVYVLHWLVQIIKKVMSVVCARKYQLFTLSKPVT
jgi:hypothetical protein